MAIRARDLEGAEALPGAAACRGVARADRPAHR
jgi:hypothetical protein